MLGRFARIASASGGLAAMWMTYCDKIPDNMENIKDISPFFDEKYSPKSAWDEAVDNTDFSKFKPDGKKITTDRYFLHTTRTSGNTSHKPKKIKIRKFPRNGTLKVMRKLKISLIHLTRINC